MRELLGAVVVAIALVLVGAAPAAAEPPFRVDDQVTDRVGVLGANAAQARQAVQRLRADKGTQLFVVYVASFDGVDGQRWADETARLSQLGSEDVLFAVAVQDRAYGYSVPDGFSMSDAELTNLVVRRVEPRLAADDWAGAAVAMADGLRTGAGGGRGGLLVAAGVGVAAVAGGAALLVAARRRKRRADTAPGGREAPGAAPVDESAGVSTEELARRAASALIAVDDAVETSQQELAFAQAQFGDEAVTAFGAALDQARSELRQAFALRQRLDDAQPEDEATRRSMLAEIIRLCDAADKRLDEQADAFDRLRALERTAPQVLDMLTPRVDALAARLPREEERLAALRGRFAATAVAPVADDLAQARHRLDAAKAELAEARSALEKGRRGEAVVSIRAAEDATGQAETLLEAPARLEAQLEQAGARAAAARTEIEPDLQEARALVRGGDHADLEPLIARAEAALAAVDDATNPVGGALPDPLAALRQLDEAGAALDRALAAAREARQKRERTAVLLDRALAAASSAVAAAGDFIATRRGAVGAEARTRLAEAKRQLEQALTQSSVDPDAALRQAQYADALAQEALRLAQMDVDQWSSPVGGFGGGGYRGGFDLGSLVLGGILLGGQRGGVGGGWGGGGGWSPGSFGGSGTRARHGGGGRF